MGEPLVPEEVTADEVGIGVRPALRDEIREDRDKADWRQRWQAKQLGIDPKELEHTSLTDYQAGWRNSDWRSGTKHREFWRCQLSRTLTKKEARVITEYLRSVWQGQQRNATLDEFTAAVKVWAPTALVIRSRENPDA